MNDIEIQRVLESEGQPGQHHIQLWVNAALADVEQDTEIVVRIVDELESAELNQQYRHKPGPTNILSFPVEVPEGIELNLLGDLVICAPVLNKEAFELGMLSAHQWVHIIIHGVLHLLGYDHIHDDDAELMESKEIAILQQLHINNPYTEGQLNE